MIKDPMYSMIYHKPEHLVRLKWLAGTAGMTDQDFKETLEAFADTAIQHGAKRLLIDVLEFKHRPSAEVQKFRDEVTVVPIGNPIHGRNWPAQTDANHRFGRRFPWSIESTRNPRRRLVNRKEV